MVEHKSKQSCFLLFCCSKVMFLKKKKKKKSSAMQSRIFPRGQSSQSSGVEMHSNNWHLDEQGRLYMTGHEMGEEVMSPHIE